MTSSSLQSIFSALNASGVRYVIGGGLAVVAHGYLRFTADVDLMLSLDTDNLGRAIMVLKSLGYQPRAPVSIEALLDETQREQWIREKNLTVFSLNSPQHPATEVDIFLVLPIPFDQAYARSEERELLPGILARFCSVADLIAMKTKAGRPQDLEDIRQLRQTGASDVR